MSEVTTTTLKKRKWVYVQQPHEYEMAGCKCGNLETQWSEYEGHLWCDKCEIDFIPEHNGLFEGPIPVTTCEFLGVSFDRVNLDTMQVERFKDWMDGVFGDAGKTAQGERNIE